MSSTWRDVRHASRHLQRTPGFTLAAIASLALGIGATVAIGTLLDAVVLKPLPVRDAGELVALYETAPKGAPDITGGTGQMLVFSYPRFARLEQALGSRGLLAASTRSHRFSVRTPSDSQLAAATAQLVSGKYFAVMDARMVEGRALTGSDVRADSANRVAVVSNGFANRTLGGADRAVGQTLIVNGLAITVVGVATPSFVGAWTDTAADLWLPLSLQQDLGYRSNVSSYAGADRERPWMGQDSIAWLTVIGRIPATQLAQARSILESTNRAGLQDLAAAFGDQPSRDEMAAHRLAVVPLAHGFSGLRQRFGDALLVLTATVTLMLVLTCANLASLLLARASGRAREMAVQRALGATRWSLFRQSLIESALLALAGGTAGFLVSQGISQALATTVMNLPAERLPPVFAPDGRTLVFALLTTFATTLLFGVFPAWRSTRGGVGLTPIDARGGRPVSTLRSMRPLVIAQVALSFVLVMAAALFGRTLASFARVDTGFDPQGVVEVTMDPELSGYAPNQMPALRQRILTAVRALPGVTDAAFSFCALGANCTSGFRLMASADGSERRVQLHTSWVGPGYFKALNIRRVSGREFIETDTASSPRVAVISESLARQVFPNQNPIGERLGYQKFDLEIVGVVGDVRSAGNGDLRQSPVPIVYMPIEQPRTPLPISASNLQVHTSGDSAAMVGSIREAIRGVERELFVERVDTMEQRLGRVLLRERLTAYLTWAFSALALLLASVGLYGVLSYSVAGRTREIGIRSALGAQRAMLIRMVLRDAAYLVVPGIVFGAVAARLTGHTIETLLYGVSASDLPTFLAVIAVLAIVTTVAALLPARRAAGVDPVRALQAE
jgi:predicted permease